MNRLFFNNSGEAHHFSLLGGLRGAFNGSSFRLLLVVVMATVVFNSCKKSNGGNEPVSPDQLTITGFSPTHALVGETVTITGTAFTAATTVAFNGIAVTNIESVTATQLKAVVPVGATTGKIQLADNGKTAVSAADFTVDIPPTPKAPVIDWAKVLGGDEDEKANCVRQTTDGGYIVAGYTASNKGDFAGNHGNWDLWVVKLKSAGEIEWQKLIGGADNDYANAIQQTTDGGYIVAGSTANVSSNYDLWVVKLKSDGNIDWQKTFGGSGNEYAYSVQQTKDGGYIVSGSTSSINGDVTLNHGADDLWVIKLKSDGNYEWKQTYGGTGFDAAKSIQQTADGGYIVAGSTNSTNGDFSVNHGGYDFWVLKLKSDGSVEWQKLYGGANDDVANSIQQTADGGYIVAGYTNSNNQDVSGNHGSYDFWVVKLKSAGDVDWKKVYGGTGSEQANSVQQTTDGGYIVAGYTVSNDGDVKGFHGPAGFFDYWVIKIGATGSLQWQMALGGTNDDRANAIQQTKDGGYIVAGYAASSDNDVMANHGKNDFWVVKLKN